MSRTEADMVEQFRKSFLSTGIFTRRAFSSLDSLSPDQYRRRTVPGSKELIEEVVPIATLIKHLEVPGRNVRCKYVGGNDGHDAQLRLSGPEIDAGFLEPFYFIEVTSAGFPKEHLRREAMTRHGHVFGGPDIRRVGSRARGDDEVESRAVAVDGEAALDDAVKWVEQALTKKARKDYPKPCILAIDVHPDRRLGLCEWSALACRVSQAADREAFTQVFVVEWGTNTVFAV